MEMCGHSVIQLWQLAWPDWLDKTNEKEAKNNLNVSKVWEYCHWNAEKMHP